MNNSTNLAAEFFVASQLNRLGYIVTLTLGNTKEVDLLVAHPDGRKISIDTKGLKNRTNWPVSPKLVSKTHFFVLVSYIEHFRDVEYQPEVYIIPSTEIHKVISPWSGSKLVTCVTYAKLRQSGFQNAWTLLFNESPYERPQQAP